MSWKYEIDPAYAPHGAVPPEAVVAAAPSDSDGSITGPWQQNPRYRPTVLAQLLKRFPSDAFLLSFGAYLRGESSQAEFRRAFHGTEFHVLATTTQDALLVVDEGSGPAYSLYTTLELFSDDSAPSLVRLRGAEVERLAQNCAGLLINRFEHGALWLPMADLLVEG